MVCGPQIKMWKYFTKLLRVQILLSIRRSNDHKNTRKKKIKYKEK
jgi:hypothetical protein